MFRLFSCTIPFSDVCFFSRESCSIIYCVRCMLSSTFDLQPESKKPILHSCHSFCELSYLKTNLSRIRVWNFVTTANTGDNFKKQAVYEHLQALRWSSRSIESKNKPVDQNASRMGGNVFLVLHVSFGFA